MSDLTPRALPYKLIGPSDDGSSDDLLSHLNDKDARQRLQALIAEWLRMENLVVLTGSGCSCSTGGKTMASLEKAVLDTVIDIPGTTQAVKGVIEQRRLDTSAKEAADFETWLSYLVNAHALAHASYSPFMGMNWKTSPAPSDVELAWLVERLGKAIFSECALTLPRDTSGTTSASEIAPHLAFLAKLVARDSNLGRTHLFTLNYDTLFEQALELLGIQYFDGFSGRADARFDPSVYGLDIYYPGEIAEGRVRRFDKFLHFYKLHGSIHWHIERDELRARHPDLSRFAGYPKKEAKNKAAFLETNLSNLPTVGILPTANKFVQTLTIPFSHLFRSFQIRLTAPQTFLLVMGYGFGDEHVTRVIETALMNPSLVMLVVEPNPDSPTIKRIKSYKGLGKRAFALTASDEAFKANRFQHATFDDFALSIMPDVQWLDDFLRLRRFEKQIQAARPAAIVEGDGGSDG